MVKVASSRREYLLVLLLILFGVCNIAATYSRLSHVYDEAPHVAAGMQWWVQHKFDMEPKHPPLPRLMAASLLYAAGRGEALEAGVPVTSQFDFWFKGSNILHSQHSYIENLVLARLGVLPFFILSCWLVYVWARSLFGVRAALLSLASYVTLPTVAAHAGIAATDMAHAAMLLAGIMATLRWLKNPVWKESLLTGCVLGLMVGTKLSSLVHWPLAMLLITIANYAADKQQRAFTLTLAHVKQFFIVLAIFIFVLSALFFFSYDTMRLGLHQLYEQNSIGHATWLWHALKNHGVWYYFPVVYFFKTPIFFLITNILSFVRTARDATLRAPAETFFPALAAIGVFIANMPSNINVGIRHALPVYPLLAVIAGYGLLWLWQSKYRALRIVLIAGLSWQTLDYLQAYPDRIAYYNEIGEYITSGHPERISPDSDVDWGQGFLQLGEAVQRRHITQLYSCFWLGGSIRDLKDTLGLEPMGCPEKPIHGWLAVSRVERLLSPEKTAWLDGYIPLENIGKTIWLYQIK